MLERITELYETFLVFTKENPVVAGLVGLWGLTVITLLFKQLPLRIYNFIKRQATTTLVINSSDDIYIEFLEWVSTNKFHSFVRTVNYTNKTKYGYGKDIMTIGYGTTMFFHNKRLFFLSRNKEQGNQTSERKETITVTLLGRKRSIFEDLFDTIKREKKEDDSIKIYKYSDGWVKSGSQNKRNLDTVILEEDTKDRIVNHISNFINKKDWYINYGIPYRTGVILHGPPGTGKTSLIKALSSLYELDLYIVKMSKLHSGNIDNVFSELPEKCLVAIEDIDTANLKKRKIPKTEDEILSDSENNVDLSSLVETFSLGDLLNAIDGITSSEGRIIIATSNDIESLDEALIRTGRFDITEYIGYMSDTTFVKYFTRFFPEYDGKLDDFRIKNNIPTSDVQQSIFENLENPEKILDMYRNE